MLAKRPNAVRFDEALAAACAVVRRHVSDLGPRFVLIRDLYGYIAVVADRVILPELETLRADLHRALGGFSPGADGVLLGLGDISSIDAILADPDAMPADDLEPEIRLVERQLVGSDWWKGQSPELTVPPRVVFYGIKGGVGRSTALAITAWHLASKGRRVLAVDLDLESPGVSSLLLPPDRSPRFGVTDWLVESAVDQADGDLLENMLAPSPLAADTPGEIWVVPAGGRNAQTYAAKLARAYLSVTDPKGVERPFAGRLEQMLQAVAGPRPPDIVLLDSRAGIHDIAAAAITHLGAQTLLFASGSEQTFWAYDALFRELRRSPRRARSVRQGLKLVAALIPNQGRAEHMAALVDRAYRLFQDNLYDEVPAGEVDGFNYDRDDPAAPHYPLTVYWAPEFAGNFNPTALLPSFPGAQIQSAFGALLRGVEDLLSE